MLLTRIVKQCAGNPLLQLRCISVGAWTPTDTKMLPPLSLCLEVGDIFIKVIFIFFSNLILSEFYLSTLHITTTHSTWNEVLILMSGLLSVKGNMPAHATSFIWNMSTFFLVVGGIGRANTYHLSTGEYALSTPKLYHLSALSSTILWLALKEHSHTHMADL